ncbi:MAG: FliM/FliN family flagellar motor switch protein [Solirubrobacteraceae bacterium]|nr:FliM/FliN family flagellar motor switch protein [Solirubrobacteraceae bacterium]
MSESPTRRIAESGGRRPWLRPVDFQAPSALAPDQQARLRKLADDVCDVIASRALKDLAMTIHFEPLEMRETTWREAQRVPAEEAITTTIEASGGGQLYQVMDPALASVLVERLLGADPDPSLPPRPLTAIDRSLLRRVNELVVASWDQLWSDLTDTTLTPGAAQPHKMLAMAHDAGEPTLLIAFQVRLAGSYAVLHILLPQATVAPVAERFSRPSARGSIDDPAATQALQSRLGGAGVSVHVRLGRVRLTASAISQLHPGDRVPLGVAPTAPATLVVDGVTVQFGHVGRSGTRRAVQIGSGAVHAQGVA